MFLADQDGVIWFDGKLVSWREAKVHVLTQTFCTGTAEELLPIRELDGRRIGTGQRGPITEKLQSMYFDQVMGRRNENPEWSTYIN